jgi:serine phosphatase RsbU (regulator of sigma subunit)
MTLMQTKAEDGTERLAELDKLELMYSRPEEMFDRITKELSRIFEAPVVMMNLMDDQNQYIKSASGLPDDMMANRTMPRQASICSYVVQNNKPLIVEDLAADERFRENLAVTQHGARFYAGAPLRTETGQAIGSLCVVDNKPRKITLREKQLLEMVANGLMTLAKLRATSRQLVHRTREMERDMISARNVQRFLLPPRRQEGKGFVLWQSYHPVDAIGGDFIDARLHDDGSLAMLIADVTGHGASAALASAMVKTVFQRAASDGAVGPAQILSAIQADLSASLGTGQFITAAAAVFDPSRRTALLAGAGHPFPILLRDGKARLVQTANDLPLLIEPTVLYHDQTEFPLDAGDRMIWYTDGAPEAVDADGKPLDIEGLMGMIQARAALDGDELLSELYRDIRAYASARLHDDVALVCLEVK